MATNTSNTSKTNTSASTGKRRPKRRMKKQVRRTIGALLLASAIGVAAIPVEPIQATVVNGVSSHTVTKDPVTVGTGTDHGENYAKNGAVSTSDYAYSYGSDASSIPLCDSDITIYSTGDGKFKFGYVNSSGQQSVGGQEDKFAVILGYQLIGELPGGALTIPDNVDAYLNYDDSNAGISGYCAVGRAGNYLFYETDTSTETNTTAYYYLDNDKANKTNADGEPMYWLYLANSDGSFPVETTLQISDSEYKERKLDPTLEENVNWKVEPIMVDVYHNFLPCRSGEDSTWKTDSAGNPRTLYYYETNDYKPTGTRTAGAHVDRTKDDTNPGNLIPQAANDQAYSRIANVTVNYIGKQYLNDENTAIAGTIDESNGKTRGIFANNGNIHYLTLGSNLSGISDYSFYGCGAIESISVGNGINTLGNHAFDGCRNMTNVNIPAECNLSVIGAYCFKDCQALTSWDMPISVTTLGDGCFKGCTKIQTINLFPNGKNGSLSKIGQFVFKDCESLTSLTFPNNFTQNLEISEFEGCKSLEKIVSENNSFNIIPSKTCDYNWDDFKLDAKEGTDIKDKFYMEGYNTSSIHETCTENEVAFKYFGQEVYEVTKDEEGTGDPKITYQVNNNNELVGTVFKGDATSLTFPDFIGPYHINTIGNDAFADKCSLKKITIPSTISSIGDRAFKGCHNLEYVYFNTDTVTIGKDAFKTQDVTSHQSPCTGAGMNKADGSPATELAFIGNIDINSEPYKYAMSYEGRYNNPSQATSFITYYSGWPTMLEVKYALKDPLNPDSGYSELQDFPTMGDIKGTTDYKVKYPYLTDDEVTAATNAATYVSKPKEEWSQLSEAARTFVNSAFTLTVPTGIEAIKDNLYKEKTESGTTNMDVILAGVDNVEKADFNGCSRIGTVTFAGTSDGNTIKNIEKEAFDGCSNLQGVISEVTVNNIGERAFADNDKLTNVVFQKDIKTVAKEAFADDPELLTVALQGNVDGIDDYAFKDDDKLNSVTISGEVNEMGLRPWAGCETLSDVKFENSANYRTDNSIVYGLDAAGNNSKVIEVLESRVTKITADEMDNVASLAEEAFMDSKVKSIDLSSSSVSEIPTHAFANTEKMQTITLPSSANVSGVIINDNAFEGSHVEEITGGSNINIITPNAFDGIVTESGNDTGITDTTHNKEVTIYAPAGSYLETFAKKYKYTVAEAKDPVYYTVTFRDWDPEKLEYVTVGTVKVAEGDKVPLEDRPTPNGKDGGYRFDKWVSNNDSSTIEEIWENTTLTADYVYDESYGKCLCQFYYYDEINDPDHNSPILLDYSEYVTSGGTVEHQPSDKLPKYEGYSFKSWSPAIDLAVTKPTDYYANYNEGYTVKYFYVDPTATDDTGAIKPKTVEYMTVEGVTPGSDATKLVAEPKISGYTFQGWQGSSSTGWTDLENVTCDMQAMGTFIKKGQSDVDGYYKVNFYDGDNLLFTLTVEEGSDVSNVSAPSKDGATFKGWAPSPTNVTSNMNVVAKYEPNGSPTPGPTPTPTPTPSGTYTVTFYNYDDTVVSKQVVNAGGAAETPPTPSRPGYKFTGWKPSDFTNINSDLKVYAMYEYDGGNNNNNNGNKFTVTVVNGSGSGTYSQGATVVIAANNPTSGKTFDKWTTGDVTLASTQLSATTFTMPAKNVTVTANYKDGGSARYATGNSTRPVSTGQTAKGNTQVIVSKDGVSHVDLASATVRGSKDSFVVRVTETNEATNAVENALNNRFGSLDGLQYWACDISLYDSTGNTKITDTTGLTVDITLPIPDALKQYGGNNKAGAVANNQLENLNTKFNTINGTPTVTFTATHFSPYVIYADTNNLNASQMLDASPKTGDPIHPKWFLSIGLFAASIVMFLKRDKRKVVVK